MSSHDGFARLIESLAHPCHSFGRLSLNYGGLVDHLDEIFSRTSMEWSPLFRFFFFMLD